MAKKKESTIDVGDNGIITVAPGQFGCVTQYSNVASSVATTSTTDEMQNQIDTLEKRVKYLENLMMGKKIDEMDDL